VTATVKTQITVHRKSSILTRIKHFIYYKARIVIFVI